MTAREFRRLMRSAETRDAELAQQLQEAWARGRWAGWLLRR